jgi:hypothetical protein
MAERSSSHELYYELLQGALYATLAKLFSTGSAGIPPATHPFFAATIRRAAAAA